MGAFFSRLVGARSADETETDTDVDTAGAALLPARDADGSGGGVPTMPMPVEPRADQRRAADVLPAVSALSNGSQPRPVFISANAQPLTRVSDVPPVTPTATQFVLAYPVPAPRTAQYAGAAAAGVGTGDAARAALECRVLDACSARDCFDLARYAATMVDASAADAAPDAAAPPRMWVATAARKPVPAGGACSARAEATMACIAALMHVHGFCTWRSARTFDAAVGTGAPDADDQLAQLATAISAYEQARAAGTRHAATGAAADALCKRVTGLSLAQLLTPQPLVTADDVVVVRRAMRALVHFTVQCEPTRQHGELVALVARVLPQLHMARVCEHAADTAVSLQYVLPYVVCAAAHWLERYARALLLPGCAKLAHVLRARVLHAALVALSAQLGHSHLRGLLPAFVQALATAVDGLAAAQLVSLRALGTDADAGTDTDAGADANTDAAVVQALAAAALTHDEAGGVLETLGMHIGSWLASAAVRT